MKRKGKLSSLYTKESFASLAGFSSYHEYFQNREKTNPFLKLSFQRLQSFEFTSEYIVANGLDFPILIESHTVDFIKFPTTKSVYECFNYLVSVVGETMSIRVINVAKQQDESMTISQYKDYFVQNQENQAKDNLTIFNLISFELSLTPLATRIIGPKPIRDIDWIDQIWPIERRALGDYPRVQKYCLISMSGSYTDFHIDFGGTSVWYHVIKGLKVFYMIKPTKRNLLFYERWLGSKKQNSQFFGDIIGSDQCFEIRIYPGETLVIPSGWIHAVWTLQDSLVFGGNFLSFYTILKQLQIYGIEYRSNIEDIYRFPYYKQMNCYTLTSLYSVAISQSRKSLFENDIDSKEFRQKPKIYWHYKVWVTGGSLAIEDRKAFDQAINSLGSITSDEFFTFWWNEIAYYAKIFDEKTMSKEFEENLVQFSDRVKNAASISVFEEDRDDSDNCDDSGLNGDDDDNDNNENEDNKSGNEAIHDQDHAVVELVSNKIKLKLTAVKNKTTNNEFNVNDTKDHSMSSANLLTTSSNSNNNNTSNNTKINIVLKEQYETQSSDIKNPSMMKRNKSKIKSIKIESSTSLNKRIKKKMEFMDEENDMDMNIDNDNGDNNDDNDDDIFEPEDNSDDENYDKIIPSTTVNSSSSTRALGTRRSNQVLLSGDIIDRGDVDEYNDSDDNWRETGHDEDGDDNEEDDDRILFTRPKMKVKRPRSSISKPEVKSPSIPKLLSVSKPKQQRPASSRDNLKKLLMRR